LKVEMEFLQAEKRATEDLLDRELNDREQAHLLLLKLVGSLQDRVETLEAVLTEQTLSTRSFVYHELEIIVLRTAHCT